MHNLTQTVDATLTGGAPGSVPSLNSNLRYFDMNVSTGGVARGSEIGGTFTNIYNQSGSGLLIGFLVTLENAHDDWQIRLIVDGNTIFDLSTRDLEKNDIYNFNDAAVANNHLGFDIDNDTIRWRGPLLFPMVYSSSVRIEIKYNKTGTKKFRAGLVSRTI